MKLNSTSHIVHLLVFSRHNRYLPCEFFSLKKIIHSSIYLFVPVLGLCLVAVCGFLIVVVSLVAECELCGERASIVVSHGISCSSVCGIFPDQGSNLCLLHWQTDSLLLSHQGSPSRPYS